MTIKMMTLRKLPGLTSPTIKYTKKTVFFGHWARLSQLNNHHTVCMDGGYVYGGELLGIRLEDGQLFKLKNQQTNL